MAHIGRWLVLLVVRECKVKSESDVSLCVSKSLHAHDISHMHIYIHHKNTEREFLIVCDLGKGSKKT